MLEFDFINRSRGLIVIYLMTTYALLLFSTCSIFEFMPMPIFKSSSTFYNGTKIIANTIRLNKSIHNSTYKEL